MQHTLRNLYFTSHLESDASTIALADQCTHSETNDCVSDAVTDGFANEAPIGDTLVDALGIAND